MCVKTHRLILQRMFLVMSTSRRASSSLSFTPLQSKARRGDGGGVQRCQAQVQAVAHRRHLAPLEASVFQRDPSTAQQAQRTAQRTAWRT